MSSQMASMFAAASLATPTLMVFAPLGGAPDWPGFTLVAETLRSVMSSTIALGIATEEEIDIDTLSDRLHEDVVSACGIVELPPLVGAWSVRL